MKITLDTSILIQAFGRGSLVAQELLHIILTGDHRLVLSNALLAESSRVLRYPRLQTIHGKSEADIYAFIGHLRSVTRRPDNAPSLYKGVGVAAYTPACPRAAGRGPGRAAVRFGGHSDG